MGGCFALPSLATFLMELSMSLLKKLSVPAAFTLLISCAETNPLQVPGVDCVANPANPACLAVGSSSSAVIPEPNPNPNPVVRGTFPSVLHTEQTAALYHTWISHYFETGRFNDFRDARFGEMGRIKWDNSSQAACRTRGVCTVSEGIAYGMLNALFMNDWATFNLLWNYSRAFRGNHGMMDWLILGFQDAVQSGVAADADLDIATALIIAHRRTGNQAYLADALHLSERMYSVLINDALLLRPGLGWGVDEFNPSYFAPVAYRLLHEVDPARGWNRVLEANYAWMELVQSRTFGNSLFPDWAGAAGNPIQPSNGSNDNFYDHFRLEAIRIPWRLSWDYLWFGEPRAKAMMERLMQYAINITQNNPANIVSGYNTVTGAALFGAGKAGQVGAFCSAGLAGGNQAWVDACNNHLIAMPIPGPTDYFPHILQIMNLQLLNGFYIKP